MRLLDGDGRNPDISEWPSSEVSCKRLAGATGLFALVFHQNSSEKSTGGGLSPDLFGNCILHMMLE